MARIDHTNCGHDRTPKARAACRNSKSTTAPVTTKHIPTTDTGRLMAEMARNTEPTIDTPSGKIRIGSVILADVRGGIPTTYTVLMISDNIKNDTAGWEADGRWGYADHVLRVITF